MAIQSPCKVRTGVTPRVVQLGGISLALIISLGPLVIIRGVCSASVTQRAVPCYPRRLRALRCCSGMREGFNQEHPSSSICAAYSAHAPTYAPATRGVHPAGGSDPRLRGIRLSRNLLVAFHRANGLGANTGPVLGA